MKSRQQYCLPPMSSGNLRLRFHVHIKVFLSLFLSLDLFIVNTLTSGSHSSEDVLKLFIVHGLGAVEPVQGIAQGSTQFMNKFKLSCVLFIWREEKKERLVTKL